MNRRTELQRRVPEILALLDSGKVNCAGQHGKASKALREQHVVLCRAIKNPAGKNVGRFIDFGI
jgi:hypothetical protein